MDEDQIPEAVHEAENAYDSLRAIAHLPQISTQLAQGLVRSLQEFDVTEFEVKDPEVSVAVAGEHLARVQNAIDGQGYRTDEERLEVALRGEGNGA